MHDPGVGSHRIAWLIKPELQESLKAVEWRGRCGAVTFSNRERCGGSFDFGVFGVHGAHGDHLHETLADLAALVRHRSTRTRLCIGDWNVDLLPVMFGDPWEEESGRAGRHADRRIAVHTFCEALGLQQEVPRRSISCPGGPHSDICVNLPITRIPGGANVLLDHPSILDWAVATPGRITDSFVTWDLA